MPRWKTRRKFTRNPSGVFARNAPVETVVEDADDETDTLVSEQELCMPSDGAARDEDGFHDARRKSTAGGARDEGGLDEGRREGAAGGAQDECQTLLSFGAAAASRP